METTAPITHTDNNNFCTFLIPIICIMLTLILLLTLYYLKRRTSDNESDIPFSYYTIESFNENASSTTPTTIHYKCINEEDILLDNTCYSCSGSNSHINPETKMCENVINAYMPSDRYLSKGEECKLGYSSFYGTCMKCNTNDQYNKGICLKTVNSTPTNSYFAQVDTNYFDPYNFS